MALKTDVQINLSSTLTGTAGLAPLNAPLAVIQPISLASGVALNQADVLFSQQATILTAGTLTLDLKGGGLLDPFGAAINPVKLKGIYIFSKPTNTTNLTLFGDANHVPILGTVATTLPNFAPGSVFLHVNPSLAGIAVTAGTGDIIKIVNAAGASAVVDIVLFGTSA